MNRKTKAVQVAVTERALLQRIDRKLKQQANPEKLCTARNDRQAEEFGRYFTVEPGSGGVALANIDLEQLGRKLGVLKSWERVG
jgi:hypothetical protein